MSYGATNRQARSQEFVPLNRVQPSWWDRHNQDVQMVVEPLAIFLFCLNLWMFFERMLTWLRPIVAKSVAG